MSKNIDIRGVFGIFIQLSNLDIAADEIRILLYLIGKTGMSKGRKVPRNISEFSKYTRTPRFNVKRALGKLKQKGLIEDTGIYVSLFANPNRKDVEGRLHESHPLFYLKFLANTKGIHNIAWLPESHLLDKELDYGFFDRFFPEQSQDDTLSRLQMEHPSDSSSPYIINIKKEKNSDEFVSSQTDPASRRFPKASGNEDQEKNGGKNPPEKSLMSPEVVAQMISTGVLDIGILTETVTNAFVELGEPMSIQRIIKEISPWVQELGRVYEAGGPNLSWAQQIVFNWKTYYLQEKNREKMTDAKSSLALFFSNARKPK